MKRVVVVDMSQAVIMIHEVLRNFVNNPSWRAKDLTVDHYLNFPISMILQKLADERLEGTNGLPLKSELERQGIKDPHAHLLTKKLMQFFDIAISTMFQNMTEGELSRAIRTVRGSDLFINFYE